MDSFTHHYSSVIIINLSILLHFPFKFLFCPDIQIQCWTTTSFLCMWDGMSFQLMRTSCLCCQYEWILKASSFTRRCVTDKDIQHSSVLYRGKKQNRPLDETYYGHHIFKSWLWTYSSGWEPLEHFRHKWQGSNVEESTMYSCLQLMNSTGRYSHKFSHMQI